jgi:hypothetical protein
MDIVALQQALQHLPEAKVEVNGNLARVSWKADNAIQRVMLEDLSGSLVLLSVICQETQLDPRRALRACTSLASGGIALIDASYVLRITIPRRDESTIGTVVPYVAAEAGRLRQSLVRVPTAARSSEAFSHYDS